MIRILAIGLQLSIWFGTATAVADSTDAQVRRYVENQRSWSGLTGVAVAVIRERVDAPESVCGTGNDCDLVPALVVHQALYRDRGHDHG